MTQPTVTPIRPSAVALAAVVGAGIVWVGVQVAQLSGWGLPVVSSVAWAPMALLGLGTVWVLIRARRKLRSEPLNVEPLRAVRWLAWGRTSLIAGAFLGGAWLAFGVASLPGIPAPLAWARVFHAAIAVIVSVGWAVVGWLLERACLIPTDPDDDESATPPPA